MARVPHSTEVKPIRAERVTEGLYWGEVYFVVGKPSDTGRDNDVSDPPWAGYGRVFVIDKGGKSVTLFCPTSIDAYQVSRTGYEFRGLKPDRFPFNREEALRELNFGWEAAGRYNLQKDFDTAAMVLNMLGAPVPLRIVPEGAEPDKPRGGKEADEVGLIKPVKREGRRGQVLAFFLQGARSIREAMAEFGVTRSNLLSQLYLLQKEHGIGYSLVGDSATVALPPGCEDPFEAAK